MKKPRIPPAVIDKNPSPDAFPKKCCWVNCEEEGVYRAPKSPHLKAYYWFCLEHIRHYNASWDFFSGMSPEQVETYQRNAMLGHRPTWKINSNAHVERDVVRKLHRFFHQSPAGHPSEEPLLPPREREALALMDLTYPVTLQQIKIRYKALVKTYHPDMNQNDVRAEEMFKKISTAYRFLITSSFFKK